MQGVSSVGRRAELFAAYSEALRQVAAQRVAKAEDTLTQLLVKLNVGPESDWAEVSDAKGGMTGLPHGVFPRGLRVVKQIICS